MAEKTIRCKCCKGEAYGYLVAAMIGGKCPYCHANCKARCIGKEDLRVLKATNTP